MANIVDNELNVYTKHLGKVKDLLINKDGFFDMNLIAPPEDDSTEAAVDAWGQKWDISENELSFDIDDNCFSISYNTVWSYPDKYYEKLKDALAEIDPDAYIEYYYDDPYMSVYGCYENGIEEDYSYPDRIYSEEFSIDIVYEEPNEEYSSIVQNEYMTLNQYFQSLPGLDKVDKNTIHDIVNVYQFFNS